jgi:aspartyl-tRNA(Asn)/glutamyl-tRNA(Gln) amidotransferase subunit A
MMDADLQQLTLAGAARMIAEGKLSPEELTADMLSRIERLNPEFHAFITIMKPRGAIPPSGPLRGIPISVKDLFDTRGVRTTGGSKIFADRIPGEDATAVARLTHAGAVIIGKTNLHEFAYGVTTVNPHYGAARNPWDRERITGGSSGGSAGAVALGMGLASLGTDTGGSVRIPAALCGIVGLKPTYGRVSLNGIIPLAWSLDHAGPMTRTVEDAAILLEVIAGHDTRDPYSRDADVPRYTEALNRDIKGLRLGIPGNYFFDQLAPAVDTTIGAALREFQRLGAEIIPIEVPGIPYHRAAWLQIASAEAYAYHEHFLRRNAGMYGADVRGRLEAGRQLLSVDYVRAQRARALLKSECSRVFERVDVIVTPTVPVPAPRIADAQQAAPSLTRFTRYFNLVGLPAISIPCGFTPEGLPVGMQIVGKAFDESMVLGVAHAYEQQTTWRLRRPAM